MRGSASGAINMARDLELVEIVRAGTQDFILETYMWQPWAVSLGKHQCIDVVDLQKTKKLGIDVVWRPTGGRAVLHADELTYCVATRGKPREVYRAVHSIIHSALDAIIPGAFAEQKSPTNLRQFYASGTPMGQACFASSVQDELMHHGKKVVGSAQRVIDGIVLQHGSILCGPSHENLADLLNLDEDNRIKFRESLKKSSISLSEIAGKRIEPLDVAYTLDQAVSKFETLSASSL